MAEVMTGGNVGEEGHSPEPARARSPAGADPVPRFAAGKRPAYFTAAEEPCGKLNRVPLAEIEEAAWNCLHRTGSRTFPRPEPGKIAVKVINHGDDV